MKKSNFVAMIMGTAGGILFAIGMCMCLLPEWEAFQPGVIMGAIGTAIILVAVIIWRKMEGRTLHMNKKAVGVSLFGIAGSLLLGVGMCFAMIWGNMFIGIPVGVAGIVMLLSLIPLTKGFTKPNTEAQV